MAQIRSHAKNPIQDDSSYADSTETYSVPLRAGMRGTLDAAASALSTTRDKRRITYPTLTCSGGETIPVWEDCWATVGEANISPASIQQRGKLDALPSPSPTRRLKVGCNNCQNLTTANA